jgi:hypothetical protein
LGCWKQKLKNCKSILNYQLYHIEKELNSSPPMMLK